MSEAGRALAAVSPLGGAAVSAGLAIVLEEVAGRGMIAIRADLDDGAVRDAISGATGCAVPDIRRMSRAGDRALGWMAPDEALLLCPRDEVGALHSALEAGLSGAHHLVVDMSDARALFRLKGAAAREVLGKGAPVDLSPEAFGPADLRRTHLGQVAAAFWMAEGEDEAFELICFRSVAAHVFEWLTASAQERAMPSYY